MLSAVLSLPYGCVPRSRARGTLHPPSTPPDRRVTAPQRRDLLRADVHEKPCGETFEASGPDDGRFSSSAGPPFAHPAQRAIKTRRHPTAGLSAVRGPSGVPVRQVRIAGTPTRRPWCNEPRPATRPTTCSMPTARTARPARQGPAVAGRGCANRLSRRNRSEERRTVRYGTPSIPLGHAAGSYRRSRTGGRE